MPPRRVAPGQDGSQAQEEMTVVILKIKGDSGTLQKGFDALQQAFAALAPSHSRTRSTAPPQLPAGDGQVFDNNEEHPPGETDLAEDQVREATASAKTKRTGPRQRFLKEFDLSPPGVPSLKDYCTQKDPQTEQDKFLVVSAWIQTHGGANPFTPDHVFTCFRAMEWKAPVDMAQRLRNLKAQKSYFDQAERGEWQLTVVGMAAAEKIAKE